MRRSQLFFAFLLGTALVMSSASPAAADATGGWQGVPVT